MKKKYRQSLTIETLEREADRIQDNWERANDKKIKERYYELRRQSYDNMNIFEKIIDSVHYDVLSPAMHLAR